MMEVKELGVRDFIAKRLLNITTGSAFKMVSDNGNSFCAWSGDAYDSDIVESLLQNLIWSL